MTASSPAKTRIDISLSSFTAQLLDEGGIVLAEMDVSPGVPGHETPLGKFYVREKLPLKRSNLYGQYVRPGSGEVVVPKTWEHKGPKPEGTVYQGIAMPWWLRLTDDGVGIHVGGFSRGQPTSHGCIRCPDEGQQVFWRMSRVGTPVHVHDGAHSAPSLLDTPQS
ncbi:MAG: L,D-transpeptidase [Gloeobacteraceae cyanobacterium ES-bin-144]|nr:L,D-transpeptidase [Verrucomicrobiales bacterium]